MMRTVAMKVSFSNGVILLMYRCHLLLGSDFFLAIVIELRWLRWSYIATS